MQKKAFRQLEKRVKEIEKSQSLASFALNSTNLDKGHKMKIEEASSVYQSLGGVYQDLKDLELADLEDFKNMAGSIDGECS